MVVGAHLMRSAPSRGARFNRRNCTTRAAAPPIPQDTFISNALDFASDAIPTSELRDAALSKLATSKMPTRNDESFRFTDISRLLSQRIVPPETNQGTAVNVSCPMECSATTRVVLSNGVVDESGSDLTGLPTGMYVGSLSGAPAEAREKLGHLSRHRGAVFDWLNSAAAHDVLVCYLPSGVECLTPLHVNMLSTSASQAEQAVMYSPRVLVVAEPGSKVEVVEEFAGQQVGRGQYFMNSVTEIIVAEEASVSHRVVQMDDETAFHIKSTFVSQKQHSAYELIEATLGGQLSRHDVAIEQGGVNTSTTLRHFLLCGQGQLHDVHSSLVLNHPEGSADQLHKCIVSHASGQGVFDGNVQVNKAAQRTDAGQLSRNLLLAPKATVNVKPNLQIVADDVKCTHGCAVSDLSQDELFYFRARGISAEEARKALVDSFGAEIVQLLEHKELVERTRKYISEKLASVA